MLLILLKSAGFRFACTLKPCYAILAYKSKAFFREDLGYKAINIIENGEVIDAKKLERWKTLKIKAFRIGNKKNETRNRRVTECREKHTV